MSLGDLWGRVTASHAWRSWDRYNGSRGNVLAGGVTYLGFFSIIPALALGFAIVGLVVRGKNDLLTSVTDQLSDLLPGIVVDASHPDGLIDPTSPPAIDVLTVTGIVGFVTLLLSGTGWVDALREGVRAVFGQPPMQINPVKGKLRDLVMLATVGLAFGVSGALSLVTQSAGSWLLRQVGLEGSTFGTVVLTIVSFVVVFLADALLMVVVLRIMSGLPLPRADVVQGAVVGAIGLGVLKLLSGRLLASAANKPLLAGFAVIVGLLVLINLVSRVMLLAAAWAATTADERGHLAVGAAAPQHALPLGPREQTLPSFGQRSTDRVSIAAGAVLGATALVAARAVGGGVRTVLGRGRHHDDD
ncbi:YihY/virulence factor BrkB family protein [Angustibacter aerolatus]